MYKFLCIIYFTIISVFGMCSVQTHCLFLNIDTQVQLLFACAPHLYFRCICLPYSNSAHVSGVCTKSCLCTCSVASTYHPTVAVSKNTSVVIFIGLYRVCVCTCGGALVTHTSLVGGKTDRQPNWACNRVSCSSTLLTWNLSKCHLHTSGDIDACAYWLVILACFKAYSMLNVGYEAFKDLTSHMSRRIYYV